MKCIADGIVESVDDCLELRAQAVEIHRRGDDEHLGLGHFFVDDLHVVFLAARMVFAGKARIAPDAGIDLVIVNGDDFDMVPWRGTLHERLYQQIRIAALARTTRKNQNIHT